MTTESREDRYQWRTVQLIPVQGEWVARYTSNNGQTESYPIIAWALQHEYESLGRDLADGGPLPFTWTGASRVIDVTPIDPGGDLDTDRPEGGVEYVHLAD